MSPLKLKAASDQKKSGKYAVKASIHHIIDGSKPTERFHLEKVTARRGSNAYDFNIPIEETQDTFRHDYATIDIENLSKAVKSFDERSRDRLKSRISEFIDSEYDTNTMIKQNYMDKVGYAIESKNKSKEISFLNVRLENERLINKKKDNEIHAWKEKARELLKLMPKEMQARLKNGKYIKSSLNGSFKSKLKNSISPRKSRKYGKQSQGSIGSAREDYTGWVAPFERKISHKQSHSNITTPRKTDFNDTSETPYTFNVKPEAPPIIVNQVNCTEPRKSDTLRNSKKNENERYTNLADYYETPTNHPLHSAKQRDSKVQRGWSGCKQDSNYNNEVSKKSNNKFVSWQLIRESLSIYFTLMMHKSYYFI